MDGNAIILTNGLLDDHYAKTAHGLIRGTERYRIVGVIDPKFAGKDAGEVLDGKHRDIPIYATVADFSASASEQAQFCLVGIANKGGRLPKDLIPVMEEAMAAGCSIVNGLHEFVSDLPELNFTAHEHRVKLFDIRKPKPSQELHFWSGDIVKVNCPKIAVLGTDCNMGKRTTARFLKEALTHSGHKAEMIYTGQTGWMQGGKYGFIFDSTLNDFISGEIEHAIVTCYEKEKPDVILIEGQSSLLNPTGPCGSEFLLSGETDGVVLQHDPSRDYFHGCEGYERVRPSLEKEMTLIKLYGSEVLAVTLNTSGLTEEEAKTFAKDIEEAHQVPVILPLYDNHERLSDAIGKFVKGWKKQ